MCAARPYVIVNIAATVDGKIDTVERCGARISSESDRDRVDRLRASVDAVMVGGRTVHAEDPRLTVKSEALRAERLARGEPAQPAKVAIASRLNLRADGRFVGEGGGRVIAFVAVGGADTPLSGVEIYEVGDGRVDLPSVMARLSELGVRRVLVEGGGTLIFHLLQARLVDELQVYVAPMVFGGATAPTLADGPGFTSDVAVRLGQPRLEVWEDGGVLLSYSVSNV